jgi:MORN repeat variant
MFKTFTVLLFSLPFLSSGQTEIYPLPTSPEIIWNKCIALHDAGHLDSVKTAITHFKDPFNKIEDIKEFYVYTDTVKYDDSSYAVGQIILDPSMEFERRKIGEWTFYYPSGKIYSKGSYSIGAYTECQFAGPRLIGYSFKTGMWNYWHENGVVMAEGIYEPTSREVETNCGSDTIKVSGVTIKWHIFDSSGIKLNDAGDVISRINNSH